MRRLELDSPECGEGCSPCFLDCAMCRIVMQQRLRDIEILRRERPSQSPERLVQWRQSLEEAQAHVSELQLTLERLTPKHRSLGMTVRAHEAGVRELLH